MSAPDRLVVGRVLRPHGVRGELSVQVLSDAPERFVPGTELGLGDPDGPGPLRVAVPAVNVAADPGRAGRRSEGRGGVLLIISNPVDPPAVGRPAGAVAQPPRTVPLLGLWSLDRWGEWEEH